MATTNRGFAVPEGGDDVDIPGDVVNLTNTIIPGKTTAQLAAMSWADKPAGWLAYDTTLGKIVKSTGGSMVELTEGGPYLPMAHFVAGFVAASSFISGGPWWVSNVSITLPSVPSGSTGWALTATPIGVPNYSVLDYDCVAELTGLAVTVRVKSVTGLTGVAYHAIAY